MISLFGNRPSLQEEVNKVLSQDPSTHRLSLYKKTLDFEMSGEFQDQAVKHVIFHESTVSEAD